MNQEKKTKTWRKEIAAFFIIVGLPSIIETNSHNSLYTARIRNDNFGWLVVPKYYNSDTIHDQQTIIVLETLGERWKWIKGINLLGL